MDLQDEGGEEAALHHILVQPEGECENYASTLKNVDFNTRVSLALVLLYLSRLNSAPFQMRRPSST